MGGWEVGIGVPAILWNIIDFKKVKKMHKEIIKELKGDIEHFNDPEMDFTPHIGIALGKEEKIEELKEIINRSKEDPEFELTIDNFYIFYPNGPKNIFDSN
jgi:2'-5' RNA ligase